MFETGRRRHRQVHHENEFYFQFVPFIMQIRSNSILKHQPLRKHSQVKFVLSEDRNSISENEQWCDVEIEDNKIQFLNSKVKFHVFRFSQFVEKHFIVRMYLKVEDKPPQFKYSFNEKLKKFEREEIPNESFHQLEIGELDINANAYVEAYRAYKQEFFEEISIVSIDLNLMYKVYLATSLAKLDKLVFQIKEEESFLENIAAPINLVKYQNTVRKKSSSFHEIIEKDQPSLKKKYSVKTLGQSAVLQNVMEELKDLQELNSKKSTSNDHRNEVELIYVKERSLLIPQSQIIDFELKERRKQYENMINSTLFTLFIFASFLLVFHLMVPSSRV